MLPRVLWAKEATIWTCGSSPAFSTLNSCMIWFSNSCALVKDTCVTCGVGCIPYHLLLPWVLSLLPVSLLVGLKVIYFFIVAGYFSAGWVNWAALLWGHEIAGFGGKKQQRCETRRGQRWRPQDCTLLWPVILGHLKLFMKLYPQSVHTWIHWLFACS